MTRDQARSWSTRCRSRWSRWSTTSRSTSAARSAELLDGDGRAAAAGYYALIVPALAAHRPARRSPPARRAELDRFGAACRTRPELAGMVQTLFDHLLPRAGAGVGPRAAALDGAARQQRLRPRAARADPRRPAARPHRPGAEPPAGQQPTSRTCEPDDVVDADRTPMPRPAASSARRRWPTGAVAVVSLAGGRRQPLDAGRRRGQGAAPVLQARRAGTARFIEIHLAKSRRIGRACGTPLPHVVTTSYLTHEPIEQHLARRAATTATRARCCSRRAARSACA